MLSVLTRGRVPSVVNGPRGNWPVAFWLTAFLFAATMLGTTLPTPLYALYERQWGFGAGMVTVVFSTYAAGVLVALLLAGRSSDQVGRRPVLAAGLGFSAVSTVVFILAPGLGWLFVGRVLSGLSAGLVTGTATAALTDLVAARAVRRASVVATVANIGGLGLGPLIAGLFAEYGPYPTVLVFCVYLGLLAVAAAGLLAVPETVTHRQRLSLRFSGLAIPATGRAEFLAAGLAGFMSFSLLGMFTSLAPTFLRTVLHDHNLAVGGAAACLAFTTAAVAQVAVSRLPGRPVLLAGLGLFLAALGLLVTALGEASTPLFLIATVVSGLASGTAFIGSLSTANRLAPVDQRGQVVSTFFVLCYLGLTVPVIGLGVISQVIGDFRATLAVGIVLGVLAVGSIAANSRAESPRLRQGPHPGPR
jgi:MFS family permease